MKGIGRPQVVFGRRCKPEELEHEVWLTEAEMLLGVRFTRNVPVGKTIADAFFKRDGDAFFVELDNETMTAKEMRSKWNHYGKVDGYILVICHTKTRLRRLMRTAEQVKTVALFTRFRWLRSVFIKEPWIDWQCKRVGI